MKTQHPRFDWADDWMVRFTYINSENERELVPSAAASRLHRQSLQLVGIFADGCAQCDSAFEAFEALHRVMRNQGEHEAGDGSLHAIPRGEFNRGARTAHDSSNGAAGPGTDLTGQAPPIIPHTTPAAGITPDQMRQRRLTRFANVSSPVGHTDQHELSPVGSNVHSNGISTVPEHRSSIDPGIGPSSPPAATPASPSKIETPSSEVRGSESDIEGL